MLKESIITQIDRLAVITASARTGNLSTLAEMLRQVETLGATAREERLDTLERVSAATSDLVKRIIMDSDSESERVLSTIKGVVESLKNGAAQGQLPDENHLPPGLSLKAASTSPPPISFEDEEILADFLSRQGGVLQEMEVDILNLEKGHDPDALASLLHILHTMKGDSGFLGLGGVEQICHSTENFLQGAVPPYDVETLLQVKDWLASCFMSISAGQRDNPAPPRLLERLDRQTGEQLEIPPEPVAPAPQRAAAPGPSAAPAAGIPAAAPVPAATPAAAPAEPPAAAPEAAAEGGGVRLTTDASLLAEFISESKEHLEAANSQLLALEADHANREALNSVFRAFHTMKGIAGFLGLEEISQLAHDTENLLDRVRKEELEMSETIMDVSFEGLDMMLRLIDAVRHSLESGTDLARQSDLPALLDRVRILARGGKIDAGPRRKLGDLLVEDGAISPAVLAQAIRMQEGDEAGRKLGTILVEEHQVPPGKVIQALQKQLPEGDARQAMQVKETIRIDYDRLESMINTIGEMVLAESMISQDEFILKASSEALGKKVYNLRMVTRKLQELGTSIRMVPVAGTFQKMARLVRDLSRKSGKQINFQTKGDETELDRAFVDKIGDPLVHMIRNAVDHGIEPPAARVAAGKDAAGLVELRAFHEGGNIHVEIRDDGRGLNKEAIVAKAIERGIMTPDERLSDNEIYNLIFLPGFSTAKAVTEVSGRGVGMDVVKRNIEELRGYVQITSQPGQGTRFKIILPLTLALIDGMVVRVGKERYIFPVLSVVESLRPAAGVVNSIVGKGEMVSLRNRQVPLFRLSRIFGVQTAVNDPTQALVVIVEHEGRQAGLLVDDLVGMQQTVVKSLGSTFTHGAGFSGGAIMADGQVGLIVDVPSVLKIARGDVVRG